MFYIKQKKLKENTHIHTKKKKTMRKKVYTESKIKYDISFKME